MSDTDALIKLQRIVIESVPSEIFFPEQEVFFESHLIKGGVIVGCFVENKLIAYSTLVAYGYDSSNLGYDIGIDHKEIPEVAHLESIVVHPNYRGNNLQYYISQQIEATAVAQGFKHLCATVAPSNLYSLRNFLSLEFVFKMERYKYGGRLRYILHKPLNVLPLNHRSTPEHSFFVFKINPEYRDRLKILTEMHRKTHMDMKMQECINIFCLR
ncbi:MAG: GNAT family N-acetyltransferase [Desulfitobacterium hafniense]|nr:GNAT family N-acetyltransferase [Desulfitobacterium hafniense]